MAGAFFAGLLAVTHSPRKNPALPQQKMHALSLPQDSHIELMFGAARFGEPALSGSRRWDFSSRRADVVRRGARRTRHKCFNRHRIFDVTRTLAAPRGLTACSGALFRGQSRASGCSLPLVCRKAPEVCRKTRQIKSIRRTRAA
jgi:hypothetical protein